MRSIRVRRWLAMAASIPILASCGDGGSGPSVTPQSLAITGGNNQTATVGQSAGAALTVTVTGSDGQPFQGASVTWQVASGGGTVAPASSTTDAQGMASTQWTLGTTAGNQSVTATVQGLTGATFTATAQPGAPATVVVTPAAPTIEALQGTVQLAAALQDQHGNAVSGGTFTWSSADDAVVTVNASGLATGVATGSAVVTAMSGTISGTTTVTVAQVAASVEISPADPQLAVGTTLQLAAAVEDANGFAVAGAALTWTSADEAIATIDANGLVTGGAEGTARIRAQSGVASDSTDVLVVLTANDFVPTTNTSISGAMTVGLLTIPAGVTVTATSDVTITALDDVTIDGTLTGQCVSITVNGRSAATYTGNITNTCAAEADVDLPDITLINDGPLSITGATFTYAGDLDIRNNPAVSEDDFSDLGSRTARGRLPGISAQDAGQAAQAGGPCVVAGGEFRPSMAAGRPGTDGTATGGSGRRAGNVGLICDGDMRMSGGTEVEGRHGGAGGDALNPDPATDDGTGRGGNGGDGGDVNVRATGDLTFENINGGTTLRLTNGGDGGHATVLGRDPGGNATATGGEGGDGGNTRVEAGGSISIGPGGLQIVVGRGGHGGEAIANAGNGMDAGAEAATPGGNATATGGDAGHSVDGKLRARGAVNGLANITLSGGDGGTGGEASAVGGKGGNGNLMHPDGADGGSMTANGGKGGDARTKDITGTTIGTSGDGGDIFVNNGVGGAGADRCSVPDSGGDGGMGGDAAGEPGEGGAGDNPGDPGEITVAAATGNGGDGDDGDPAGSGGSAGMDGLADGFVRTDQGPNFEDGEDGVGCPMMFAISWETQSDPNGHTPFLGLINVQNVTVTMDGEGGIMIVGNSPWVSLSGTIDEAGQFMTSGIGTLAGFSGVRVTFNGTIEGNSITGTLTADADNNRLPPNGMGQRNPAVYQVSGTKQ